KEERPARWENTGPIPVDGDPVRNILALANIFSAIRVSRTHNSRHSSMLLPLSPYSRLASHRALVRALASRELSARYRGGALGFLWALVNPLLLLLVYATVFRFVFAPRADVRPYALFLFGGVLVWAFVSGSLQDAAETYRANGPLLRKTTV